MGHDYPVYANYCENGWICLFISLIHQNKFVNLHT